MNGVCRTMKLNLSCESLLCPWLNRGQQINGIVKKIGNPFPIYNAAFAWRSWSIGFPIPTVQVDFRQLVLLYPLAKQAVLGREAQLSSASCTSFRKNKGWIWWPKWFVVEIYRFIIVGGAKYQQTSGKYVTLCKYQGNRIKPQDYYGIIGQWYSIRLLRADCIEHCNVCWQFAKPHWAASCSLELG